MGLLNFFRHKQVLPEAMFQVEDTYLRELNISCSGCNSRFKSFYVSQKGHNTSQTICCPQCQMEHTLEAVSRPDERMISLIHAA